MVSNICSLHLFSDAETVTFRVKTSVLKCRLQVWTACTEFLVKHRLQMRVLDMPYILDCDCGSDCKLAALLSQWQLAKAFSQQLVCLQLPSFNVTPYYHRFPVLEHLCCREMDRREEGDETESGLTPTTPKLQSLTCAIASSKLLRQLPHGFQAIRVKGGQRW